MCSFSAGNKLNTLLPRAQSSRCFLGQQTTGWQQNSGWERGLRNHQSTLCEAAVWSRVSLTCVCGTKDVNNESRCIAKAGKHGNAFQIEIDCGASPWRTDCFNLLFFNFAHKHIARTLLKLFYNGLTLMCERHDHLSRRPTWIPLRNENHFDQEPWSRYYLSFVNCFESFYDVFLLFNVSS